MLRVMSGRWLQFPALGGRRFYLDTGSLSEPVILFWNEGSLLGESVNRAQQTT